MNISEIEKEAKSGPAQGWVGAMDEPFFTCVRGNAYAVKEVLKLGGFRWDAIRKEWLLAQDKKTGEWAMNSNTNTVCAWLSNLRDSNDPRVSGLKLGDLVSGL